MRSLPGLRVIIILLLAIGVAFRLVNLDHKLYWHDEVYTSMRAAGYTRQEIDQTLFQDHVVPIGALQQFQRLKPGSKVGATIHSLAVEDPQHPPLYFAVARFWMQIFGSSITASRLLPALISLCSLPMMYLLAQELFASEGAALLAMLLLALSPFDVLFAQTARQYSLLTFAVIASQFLLLKALRLTKAPDVRRSRNVLTKTPSPIRAWSMYGLSVALGLYTHPFFALTIVAQVVYVLLDAGLEVFVLPYQRRAFAETPPDIFVPRRRRTLLKVMGLFGLSLLGGLLLFMPWLYVLLTNSQRALATTDWARVTQGIGYLSKLWTLSFTSLLFDLDFGFDNPWTFLLRVPIVALIVGSIYLVCRRCSQSIWLAVVTSIAVPFLLLALPDLLLGGKRSAVSRYLISCFPGVQLAVAYLLATYLVIRPQFIWRSSNPSNRPRFKLHTPYTLYPRPHSLPIRRWFWSGVFVLLVAGSLTSCTVSALADTWWNKDLSYFNAEVARRINAASAPVIISDLGDDFTNTGDLISLSYLLKPDIPLLAIRRDTGWLATDAFRAQIRGKTAIVFRPSNRLRQGLGQGSLQPFFPSAQVWQVPQK